MLSSRSSSANIAKRRNSARERPILCRPHHHHWPGRDVFLTRRRTLPVPQTRGTTAYRTFTQVLALIGSLGLCARNQPGCRDD
jgi:hypothetical protein